MYIIKYREERDRVPQSIHQFEQLCFECVPRWWLRCIVLSVPRSLYTTTDYRAAMQGKKPIIQCLDEVYSDLFNMIETWLYHQLPCPLSATHVCKESCKAVRLNAGDKWVCNLSKPLLTALGLLPGLRLHSLLMYSQGDKPEDNMGYSSTCRHMVVVLHSSSAIANTEATVFFSFFLNYVKILTEKLDLEKLSVQKI